MDYIKFTKMHGNGNDYIYIDNRNSILQNPEQAARIWSNRHTGIGSDGLVLIENSCLADFRMRIFNADGSEAQMCGNACRCIGKYLVEHHLTDRLEVTLETLAGIKKLSMKMDHEKVMEITVDMGTPADIQPVDYLNHFPQATYVSMGNPHLVIFIDNMAHVDLENWGPQLEHHPAFPNRTNVEFAQIYPDNTIRMRVWERGSGITQACGTGACATAVAALRNQPELDHTVIHMDGGPVQIRWERSDNHIYLTGPAEEVFNGIIPWENTINIK